MTRVRLQPLARRDVEDAVNYLLTEAGTEVADRFVEAITAALEGLEEYPEVGSRVFASSPRLESLRIWPLPAFESYSIYYRYEAGDVGVLRVLHAARDAMRILVIEPLDP